MAKRFSLEAAWMRASSPLEFSWPDMLALETTRGRLSVDEGPPGETLPLTGEPGRLAGFLRSGGS